MNATKILYVDDDFDSQEQVKQFLYEAGVAQVDTVFSVDEARRRIKNVHYDVLILDEFLGLDRGHEVVQSIIDNRPIKIYLLTGGDTELLQRILKSEGVEVDIVMNKADFYSRMTSVL